MITFKDDEKQQFSLKKDGIPVIETIEDKKEELRAMIFRHDFYMRSDQRKDGTGLKKLKPEIRQIYLDCKKSLYTMIAKIEDVLREDDEKVQKM